MEINNLANQLSYTKSTITPAASVTPQVSRTSAKNMNKKELEVEVNRLRGKKGLYESSLNELRDEIKSLKSTIDELKKEREQYKPSRGHHKRVIDLEKRTAEQEQYCRRECAELVGLPENTNGEDLEDLVVEAFEVASVKVQKPDFHAIHRLANKKIVISKLVNRRDAVNLLRKLTKNYENSIKATNKLNLTKIYVNESLCPYYRKKPA